MRMLKLTMMLLLVSACALEPGATMLAQNSSQSEVQVQIVPDSDGGNLGVEITDVDLGAYTYSLQDRTTSGGSITLRAWDLRGSAGGWRVTLSGSDFVDISGSSESFDVSRLSLTAGTINAEPANGHHTNTPPRNYAIVPVSPTASTALLALPGDGAGNYVNNRQAALVIPGGTLVGDYRSTLTVTISGTGP